MATRTTPMSPMDDYSDAPWWDGRNTPIRGPSHAKAQNTTNHKKTAHNCSFSPSLSHTQTRHTDAQAHTLWDYSFGCQVRIPHICATFSLPLSLCLYPSFFHSLCLILSLPIAPSSPHPNSVFVKHSSRIKVAEILIQLKYVLST